MKKIISTLSFLFLFTISHYAQDNHCLDLDGVNDYVQVNDFALNGNFTISFWFKCNETSNVNFEERMLSFGPSTRLEIGIDSGTNKLWVYNQSGSGTQSFGEDLRDGAWHHVALVKSFSLQSVYLDGELMGSLGISNSSEYGSFYRIGAWTGGSSTATFFNGQIDETRIWSIDKPANEIEDMMYCPLSGEEDDLLAYWTYDQGVAGGANSGETTLIDFSNNAIQGTLTNFDLADNSSNWIASDNASFFYLDANLTQDGNELTAVEAGVSYQWLDCNDDLNSIYNETNQSFTATASGSYAVEVNNAFCTVISDCQDLIVVGVDDVLEDAGWSIYPNPTSDVLFFKTDFLTEVNITVSDVYGKLLVEKTVNNLLTDIDLSVFVAGTYFVQTKEEGRTAIRKFVVE